MGLSAQNSDALCCSLGVFGVSRGGVAWCVVLSSVLTLPSCPDLLLWTSR